MLSTIYIHGTLPPVTLLAIPVIYSFFHVERGLHLAKDLGEKYHHRQLADILFKKDPARFFPEKFYFFGWSGLLSHKERKLEAFNLYQAIKDLPRPIRIITHSHGGNVALQLAKVAQDVGVEDFVVDELILIACPVQRETKNLISSTVFETVYSIHSHRDVIQILDPQGIYEIARIYKAVGLQKAFGHVQKMEGLFSERHFPSFSNLSQIHVMINNRELWHIEFILPSFFGLIPDILDRMTTKDFIQRDDEYKMKFEIN